jgi:hypothetical protein
MDTATDPTAFVPSEMVKQESLTLDAAQNRVAVATRTGAATFYDAYEVEDGASGGPSNRYTQAAGALQTHDLRGNLTYDGRFYYRYDYCNRLQEVWQLRRWTRRRLALTRRSCRCRTSRRWRTRARKRTRT